MGLFQILPKLGIPPKQGEASAVLEGMRHTLDSERKLRLQLEKELNAERISKGSDILELKKQVTMFEAVSASLFPSLLSSIFEL